MLIFSSSKGWLTTDTLMIIYFQEHSENLEQLFNSFRFKIMLTASRRFATNQSEYYKNEPDLKGSNWVSFSPNTTEILTCLFWLLKPFVNDGPDNS